MYQNILNVGGDLMSLDMFSVPGLVPAHLVKYVLYHTTKSILLKTPNAKTLTRFLRLFPSATTASMHHNLTVQHIPAVC